MMIPRALLLLSFLGLAACQPDGRGKMQRLSAQDLFRLHCSTCHGDGSGNGHVAATLKVKPRNLKHRDWQTSVSDEQILNVIRNGGAARKLSPEMPAFEDKLSDQEMQALVVYLRVLGR